jgi:hypothetical protein
MIDTGLVERQRALMEAAVACAEESLALIAEAEQACDRARGLKFAWFVSKGRSE